MRRGKHVKITMSHDTWEILLPDPDYGTEYQVPQDVLNEFNDAHSAFERAHKNLIEAARDKHGKPPKALF